MLWVCIQHMPGVEYMTELLDWLGVCVGRWQSTVELLGLSGRLLRPLRRSKRRSVIQSMDKGGKHQQSTILYLLGLSSHSLKQNVAPTSELTDMVGNYGE